MTPPELEGLRPQEWIGREQTATDEITPDLARKFHATLDLPGNPPDAGQLAPPLIHFCLAQPVVATSDTGEDGHPALGNFLPAIPLPSRMWAGSAITFAHGLHVGDRVRRRSVIEKVELKRGRSGPLCFVTVLHHIESGTKIAVEDRQTLVYRGPSVAPASDEPAPSAAPGAASKPCRADPVTLFRYSALTFNGHRIHYDRRYAMERENYPGLVVHGPLQATLLLHYAMHLRSGAVPAGFTFRSASPLFDDDPFTLNAAAGTGSSMMLWTARTDGPVATSAEVRWA